MPKMFEKERWVVYLDWIYDNENTKKKEKKKSGMSFTLAKAHPAVA